MSRWLVEFEKQVQNLIDKEYPKKAGLSRDEFIAELESLKQKMDDSEFFYDQDRGYISFVIVVKSSLVPASEMVAKIERMGKGAVEKLFPHSIETFRPIAELNLPNKDTYLLVEIDRGQEWLNISPEKALGLIQEKGCSPLTIDEGIAVLTHYPDFLQKNNCFSLPGSRTENKRVPAFWLSEQQPKLGWCWNGNPHTWLGSASCKRREG